MQRGRSAPKTDTMVPRELSVSLCSLRPPGSQGTPDPRALLEQLAGCGIRAVQLDASMPGLRPRELDQSARRDLVGFLRRRGLALTGFDLFIPPAHFLDASAQNRAVDAVAGAIDLARMVGEGISRQVCLKLPPSLPGAVESALVSSALHENVTIIDHLCPPRPPVAGPQGHEILVGLDSAELLATGSTWTHAAALAGRRLQGARLRARALASGGFSDDELHDVTVALASAGFTGALVIDARGASAPWNAVMDTLARLERHFA